MDYVESSIQPSSEEGEVVELRVHGVGGAPPSQLLNEPHPALVSGTPLAGFWRRTQSSLGWFYRAPWLRGRPRRNGEAEPEKEASTRATEELARTEPERSSHYPVEAYCWGGLTSGDWTRSLWLLLTPYALANAAGWMHEPSCPDETPGSDARSRAPFQKHLTVWFCLTLTVMAVWMVAYLAVDLLAYRCGWQSGFCRASIGPLDGFVGWMDTGWGAGRAGLLLTTASIVPLVFVSVLWWAGRPSFKRYEQFEPEATTEEDEPTAPPRGPSGDVGLSNPQFWRGKVAVKRLRSAHFTAGVVATQLAMVAAMKGADLPIDDLVIWGLLGLGVLLALAVGFRVNAARDSSRGTNLDDYFRNCRWAALILLAATAVLAVALGTDGGPAPTPTTCLECWQPSDGALPLKPFRLLEQMTMALAGIQAALLLMMQGRAGRARWPRWLGFAIDVALVGMVVLIGRNLETIWTGVAPILLGLFLLTRRRLGAGKAFFGIGPSVVSSLAAFGLGAFWAGAGGLAERWLERGQDMLFTSPAWFGWVARSYTWLLGLFLVAAGILWFASRRRSDLAAARLQFGVAPSSTEDTGLLGKVASAYRLRRMVRCADRYLTVVVAISIALAGWWLLNDLRAGEEAQGVNLVAQLAVLSVPLLFVVVFRAAYRSIAGRRGIGAAWDVITFFPRTFHPFAPPCYGERAVPQLVSRLVQLTGPEGGGVAIRAHSQGTVVTAAALADPALVDPTDRKRIRVITFGSPLTVLYARIFPAYFGGLVAHLARAYDPETVQWRHFRARTDPLGTRLFTYEDPQNPQVDSGAVVDNDPICDPMTLTRLPGEDQPPILRHSTYWKHWEVDRAVAEMVADLSQDGELLEWLGS